MDSPEVGNGDGEKERLMTEKNETVELNVVVDTGARMRLDVGRDATIQDVLESWGLRREGVIACLRFDQEWESPPEGERAERCVKWASTMRRVWGERQVEEGMFLGVLTRSGAHKFSESGEMEKMGCSECDGGKGWCPMVYVPILAEEYETMLMGSGDEGETSEEETGDVSSLEVGPPTGTRDFDGEGRMKGDQVTLQLYSGGPPSFGRTRGGDDVVLFLPAKRVGEDGAESPTWWSFPLDSDDVMNLLAGLRDDVQDRVIAEVRASRGRLEKAVREAGIGLRNQVVN